MAEALRRLPPVELLSPDDVPDAAAIAARLTPALRAACLKALAEPARRPTLALAALTRAMPKVPPRPWQDVRFLIDTGQSADDDTHDHFFRVRRSGHADPLGYLRGLLLALDRYLVDLAEAPTRLDAQARGEIGAGLIAALAAALGASAPPCGFAPQLADAPRRADFAKWRWIRGHQAFAGLTQGLIFSVRAWEASDAAGAADGAQAAADLCRALLLASARALEYTGDFPVETYRDDIRGAMETPFQPKGFSGILSGDHRRFVSRVRALRPAIDRLKSAAPQTHAALLAALGQVYDSHKYVCGRFVGTDETSLLMAAECSRSAVEQIDRFKQMRLRALQ